LNKVEYLTEDILKSIFYVEVIITKSIPMSSDQLEKLLWSIAFPGFGQLLNGKLIKGLIFIFLEIFINMRANFNEIIILSFLGRIDEAIFKTDHRWLMFYPCIYLFALWDSYREAKGDHVPYSFLPFVISAFTTTVGLIYSSSVRIMGKLWGPVWLPILFCVLGAAAGLLIHKLIIKRMRQQKKS
jgi:hypothetical protein